MWSPGGTWSTFVVLSGERGRDREIVGMILSRWSTTDTSSFRLSFGEGIVFRP